MSLTPYADATLEDLCIYLQTGLNAMQVQCVAQTRAYDDLPQDPSAYPCLVIHRLEGRGEAFQNCRGVIRYLFYSQDQRTRLPGIMRWVELAIAKLLRGYENQSDPKLKVVNLDGLQSRYRIGQSAGLYPFLEIEFDFIDWVEL